MANGAGFASYKTLRPSPSPSMVGRMLGPQEPDADDLGGPPDMDMDDPGDAMGLTSDNMGALEPKAEAAQNASYGADDMPFDPVVEHGAASTQTALEAAIKRGLAGTKAQTPQVNSPYNKVQLQQLGVPAAEIELGRMTGLYGV